jgi:hypothetical protein
MKSCPSFSRSPRFTVCVWIRRVFGIFARKPFDLLEIAKWSNTSLPHRKHVQNIFVKPLKLNFISTGRSANCLFANTPLDAFAKEPSHHPNVLYPHPPSCHPEP